MGMDMSAYVLAGQTDEGHNRYDFAPLDPFKHVSIVDSEWFQSPTFRLTMPLRKILKDVLHVDFSEGFISFSPAEAVEAFEKLQSQAESYQANNPSVNPELYSGLVAFFKICVENKYSISAC
jgi:hypothetical protein